jgi:UDP-N-acetylmuramoyl-L-alanyl-D-glutamate--2,6-diaminopimelate ligase
MLPLSLIHAQLQATETLPLPLQEKMIITISIDSRTTTPNSIFLAIQGHKTEGHTFIPQAIQNGAVAVYTDQPLQEKSYPIPCFFIPDLKEKLAHLASTFYGNPSQKLWITAVTLGHGPVEMLHPLNNTTPGILLLNEILANAVQNQAEYLNLEASSHGLHQGRLDGIEIKNAIFTNLTHEHLDYHGSMESYFQAKLKLFERPELKNCILNLDNAYASRIQQQLSSQVQLLTTSLTHQKADVYGRMLSQTPEGMKVEIQVLGQDYTLLLPILAEFQLSNLLGVLANLLTQGFQIEDCLNILPKLRQVTGRMERSVLPNGAIALIDYAHTPDALFQALKGLKDQYSQVICVFGCGGGKDREKRPKMASIAEKLSDQVIVTSDNPRFEPFTQILADMMPGFIQPQSILVEPDRRLAILKAIELSTPHTVIVLAGKGQEIYMEIEGVKHPFDERTVLKEALAFFQ